MRVVMHNVDNLVDECFTAGDCWMFAYYLHHALRKARVRSTVLLLGEGYYDYPASAGTYAWRHVMVHLTDYPNLVADVRGVQRLSIAMRQWGVEDTLDLGKVKKFDEYRDSINAEIVYGESKSYMDETIWSLLETMGLREPALV